MNSKRIIKVITITTIVITLIIALYIMVHGLGLQDNLDFGAGAYFYADVPDFDKYLKKSKFFTEIPYWIYAVLFLLWGLLMYFFWLWVDRKSR